MRKRVIYLLVAVLTVLFGAYGMRWISANGDIAIAAAQPSSGAEEGVPVQTTPVTRRIFERAVVVQGNVTSKRFADVSSRVFGPLDAVYVDEGDRVEESVTLLFRVDSENLQRAMQLASQDVALAELSEQETAANLERVEADLEKATIDFERFQRLLASQAATRDAVEQQESRFKQISAQRKHAAAVVDLSRERTRQASTALAIAERNLSDSAVLAPISGVVTRRLAEPGENAEPGKPVIRIEDTATLEVAAHLPAEHYAAVQPGATAMRLSVAGVAAGSPLVSYKSPTIDPRLRTFEVRCLIEEPGAGIAPGAMAHIEVPLEHTEGLGVPEESVQLRGGQPVVFIADGGHARMVPVETGLSSDGWIAVTSPSLLEGVAVVSTGQDLLGDGDPLDVKEGGA